jgi:hypothetical protein
LDELCNVVAPKGDGLPNAVDVVKTPPVVVFFAPGPKDSPNVDGWPNAVVVDPVSVTVVGIDGADEAPNTVAAPTVDVFAFAKGLTTPNDLPSPPLPNLNGMLLLGVLATLLLLLLLNGDAANVVGTVVEAVAKGFELRC